MLIKLNHINKNIARRIMSNALKDNPNLNWMTHGDERKLHHFYNFCLDLAMIQDGAYLNKDSKGIVLFYKRGGKISTMHSIKRCWAYMKFMTKAIDVTKLFKIYKLQQRIKGYTPSQQHLYCIIIAVNPDQKNTETVIALRDFLFQQSKAKKLPIFIQTSVRRNKILFERFGFKCYQAIENRYAKYTLWLLKRDYEITSV